MECKLGREGTPRTQTRLCLLGARSFQYIYIYIYLNCSRVASPYTNRIRGRADILTIHLKDSASATITVHHYTALLALSAFLTSPLLVRLAF